jgi:cell division transport system permease protein
MILTAKRAYTDFVNNKFLHMVCVITIALSVFIVAAFALFFTNATELLDAWRKGIRIIAYLNNDVTTAQRSDLIEEIRKLSGVADIKFISKDDAFSDLKQKIGQQSSLLDGLDKNPLPDAIEIRLADSYRKLEDVQKIAQRIETLFSVNDVEYAQKWLYRFNGIYNLFKVTGLVLVGIFFIATLLIIANTIRLIMYARREELEIIRIVGADEGFIKYPLFLEAVTQGLSGAFIGLLLLYLAFRFTVPNFKSDVLFSFFEIRFIPFEFLFAIVICSMMIGWVGCYFSIRKFLKL